MKNENFRNELRLLLKKGNRVPDDQLLEEIKSSMLTETEHSEKLRKKVSVMSVEAHNPLMDTVRSLQEQVKELASKLDKVQVKPKSNPTGGDRINRCLGCRSKNLRYCFHCFLCQSPDQKVPDFPQQIIS